MTSIWDHYEEDKAMGRKLRLRTRRMRVKSQSGSGPKKGYLVVFGGLNDWCECPDFMHRHAAAFTQCKHLRQASQLLDLAEEGNAEALATIEKFSQAHYQDDGTTVASDASGPHPLKVRL